MKKFMMRMKERRARMEGKEEFTQAALTYLGLKALIIVLTILFVTCVECESPRIMLRIFHILLFSHFIYAGMRIASLVIAIICFVRGIFSLINFFLQKTFLVTLPLWGKSVLIFHESGYENWVLPVNGLFLFVITIMVMRAHGVKYNTIQQVKRLVG